MIRADWSVLLEELERAGRPDPEGYTTCDLVRLTGHGEEWVRKRIGRAMAAGRCRLVGLREEKRIDDGTCVRPVYQFQFDEDETIPGNGQPAGGAGAGGAGGGGGCCPDDGGR